MLERFHKLRRWAGVDRAVFFANSAQLMRLVTGPITMGLVIRYLSPEVQGYFYAFAGVVAMQIFLEMGFSQNILQFASHEFSKLRLTPEQKLEGDASARSRLISLGRLSFGYYAVGAVIFFLGIGLGGHIFFSISSARFSPGSFKDLPMLAARLNDPADAAAQVIAVRLSEDTRRELKSNLAERANVKVLQKNLSDDFNRLLKDASFSSALEKAGVPLPSELASGTSTTQRNRRWLESVFFQEILHDHVRWQLAWWLVAFMAALSFALQPAWNLLGGCNQMAAVQRVGFWTTPMSFALNAGALIAGAGIYVSAVGATFNALSALGYLLWRWRPFFRQFLERPQHGAVSWKREIWPFQWRIAVSWMSGYFIFDIVNPVAFFFCGPVEAGRLGMSLQLVRMIYNMAMNWLHMRTPQFGILIAARKWKEFDHLWKRSTAQAFGFGLLGFALFLAVIPFLGDVLPPVARRLAPFGVNAWLAAGLLVMIVTNALAAELRGHKREPYMWYSIANGALSAALMITLVQFWGITGEAMGYALGIILLFPMAYGIYRIKGPQFRRDAEAYHLSANPLNESGSSAVGFS